MDKLVQSLALRPDPASLPQGTRVTVNETGDTYTVRNGLYVLSSLKLAIVPPTDLAADTPVADGFSLFSTLPAYATGLRFQIREAAAADWSAAVEVTADTDDDNGAEQVSTIDFAGLADTDVADKYFLITGAAGLYYVWFNVDTNGTDPEVANATAVEIALTNPANAAAIGDAVQVAVDALADFTATDDNAGLVTITDAAKAFRTAISAGTSGAAVATTTRGVPVGTAAVAASGLTAETEYEVRVRAEHTLFDTDWSNTVTITTAAS